MIWLAIFRDCGLAGKYMDSIELSRGCILCLVELDWECPIESIGQPQFLV